MHQLQNYLMPAVSEMCVSMLELEVCEDFSGAASHEATEFVGLIHLAGETPAAVTVECSEMFARSVAGTMFATEPAFVSESDIRDAVGEFVNVAAGNLKAALEAPYLLSLPTVVEGRDFRTHLPRGRTVARCAFMSAAGRFAINVYDQAPITRD